MAGFVRLLLLVAICLIRGHHQLADPELFEAGGLLRSPFDRSGYESDVFELLPYEDRYHPPRPPRIKLVRKPAPKPLPPLNTVQKVVLTKPPPNVGSYSMSYTLGAVILALLGQAVGTVFFMVMAKLLLGIKAILATNSATLGITLWNHLKKMKHKKVKKVKPHKVHKEHHKKKKKKKTKTPEVNLVQLSKKQLKKIFKLLMKKKKKGH